MAPVRVAVGVASVDRSALGPAAAGPVSDMGSGLSVSGETILTFVLDVPGCMGSSTGGIVNAPDRDKADPGGKIAGAGPLSSAPNSRSEYVMRSSSTES